MNITTYRPSLIGRTGITRHGEHVRATGSAHDPARVTVVPVGEGVRQGVEGFTPRVADVEWHAPTPVLLTGIPPETCPSCGADLSYHGATVARTDADIADHAECSTCGYSAVIFPAWDWLAGAPAETTTAAQYAGVLYYSEHAELQGIVSATVEGDTVTVRCTTGDLFAIAPDGAIARTYGARGDVQALAAVATYAEDVAEGEAVDAYNVLSEAVAAFLGRPMDARQGDAN